VGRGEEEVRPSATLVGEIVDILNDYRIDWDEGSRDEVALRLCRAVWRAD
jgi:hypothetical protein